jgi:hypothetical protein
LRVAAVSASANAATSAASPKACFYALVRTLQLNEAESAHLFDLARTATGPRRELRTKPETRVSPLVAQLLDTMRDVPAIAMNRLAVAAGSNALGRALFPHLFPADAPPLNGARYLFLDERSKTFYLDWETSAREAVSHLRPRPRHAPQLGRPTPRLHQQNRLIQHPRSPTDAFCCEA